VIRLRDQGKLIDEGDWNHLVVLDACRYDFFREVYKEYLEGNLKKVKSRSSETSGWLAKTFTDRYDVDYVSANPYVNSAGVQLKDCTPNLTPFSWKATDHFNEIDDVWDYGWDSERGIVSPSKVTEKTLEKEGRTITHYMQPHGPYPSFDSEEERRHGNFHLAGGPKLGSIRGKIGLWLERNLGPEWVWRIRRLLGMDPTWVGEEIWRKEGFESIGKHYEKNLRLVLKEVKRLVQHLEGEIVVTADHGEGLGDEASGHALNREIPVLREVPWLKVRK